MKVHGLVFRGMKNNIWDRTVVCQTLGLSEPGRRAGESTSEWLKSSWPCFPTTPRWENTAKSRFPVTAQPCSSASP